MNKTNSRAKTRRDELRVTFERGDYFELRALIRDVEAVQFDAMKAAQEINARLATAIGRKDAKFEALAKAHGFDPTKTWRWDDATCALIEVSTVETADVRP